MNDRSWTRCTCSLTGIASGARDRQRAKYPLTHPCSMSVMFAVMQIAMEEPCWRWGSHAWARGETCAEGLRRHFAAKHGPLRSACKDTLCRTRASCCSPPKPTAPCRAGAFEHLHVSTRDLLGGRALQRAKFRISLDSLGPLIGFSVSAPAASPSVLHGLANRGGDREPPVGAWERTIHVT